MCSATEQCVLEKVLVFWSLTIHGEAVNIAQKLLLFDEYRLAFAEKVKRFINQSKSLQPL